MDSKINLQTIYSTIGSSSFLKFKRFLIAKRIINKQTPKAKALPKLTSKNKKQSFIKLNLLSNKKVIKSYEIKLNYFKKDIKKAIVEDKETIEKEVEREFNREQLNRLYLKSDALNGIDIADIDKVSKKEKTQFDFIKTIKSNFNFKINGRIQGDHQI